MLFKNAEIFSGDKFIPGSFRVENGIFTEIITGETEESGVDLKGAKVIPGLIDIHTHGNSGADFSDGDVDGLKAMGGFYAQHGVTSFLPTSMTLPYETLAKAYATAVSYREERNERQARLMGINMEGPFFSEKKKGAQNGAHLREPDFAAFKKLYDDCGGLIRIVDLASELPGAAEFTAKAAELCTVSIGHSNTDYSDACRIFDCGATHMTHLFNAMTGIHHRDPGPICAGSERENVYAELICDGLHIHPSVIRTAFKLFPDRICLISDSLRCTGMPEGEYEFGGQDIFLKNNEAHLADGTIAGSVSNVYDCMLNAISYGIDECTAIRAATINPAKQAGCASLVGSIEAGKYADFVVCTDKLERLAVYIGGTQI